jgi:hypothetical protein
MTPCPRLSANSRATLYTMIITIYRDRGALVVTGFQKGTWEWLL